MNPFEPPVESVRAPEGNESKSLEWGKHAPVASVAFLLLGSLIVLRSLVGWPSWLELVLGVGTLNVGFWMRFATWAERRR